MEANQTPDPTGYTTMAALDAEPPGGFCQPEVRYRAFREALTGVELGSWDIRIIHWLVGWDDATCRTVVSLLWRARQAGEAAAIGSVREHLASLADHVGRRLADEHADRQAIAEETATHLRMLARDAKPPAVDSESWTCAGCGAQMIGRRPAGDRCPECATQAGALEDAARQVIAAWQSGDCDWDSTGLGSLTVAVSSLHAALRHGGAANPAEVSRSPGAVVLTAEQAATARQALADAAAARRAGGWCRDCLTGECSDHTADVGRAEVYEALGRELGQHQDDDRAGELDGLEPCCTACGARCGIFQGHGPGWHHFRGDGTAEHPAGLFDAGHVPAVAWRPAEGETGGGSDACGH